MAAAASLLIRALTTMDAQSPVTRAVAGELENNTGGRFWTDGADSGEIGKAYMKAGSLASGGTDTINLLAAGSLKALNGSNIDADELKFLVVKCLTGTIEVRGAAANPIGCFTAAGEGVKLTAGQTFAIDLGAAGIDVTTNSQLEVAEVAATTATYTLLLIVAE